MKKNESSRINKKLFTVSTVFAVGFISLYGIERISEDIYHSKKNNLERQIGLNINKNVELGDFAGLSFLGFSLTNSKIIDAEKKGSRVEANSIFVRFMPLRSVLNRKLIFNIDVRKLNVNVQKDFFKLSKRNLDKKKSTKKIFNYEFYFNLKNKSNIQIYDLGLESKIKGAFVYRSYENQLIGSISYYLKDQGSINFKFNKNLNDDFLNKK